MCLIAADPSAAAELAALPAMQRARLRRPVRRITRR